jgi:hypothetical protein
MRGVEDCKDGCLAVEGKCVNDCDNIMSIEECKESEYCTWVFSRHTGDMGMCVWKKSEKYRCSDLKRYSECLNGGKIDILINKCEYYYKQGCRKKCSLYSSSSSECLREGEGECMWLLKENEEEEGDKEEDNKEHEKGRCILKV